MNEHQPPEPDPEPLGATSFESVDEGIDETAEIDRLMRSFVKNIETIITREDAHRKTTFVFRIEKILPLPESPDGSRVHLHHYGNYALGNSAVKNIYAQEYEGRRLAGIDISTPVANGDGKEAYFSVKKYQIEVDENQQTVLKRYSYDKKHNKYVARSVSEETIIEIGMLIRALRGDEQDEQSVQGSQSIEE